MVTSACGTVQVHDKPKKVLEPRTLPDWLGYAHTRAAKSLSESLALSMNGELPKAQDAARDAYYHYGQIAAAELKSGNAASADMAKRRSEQCLKLQLSLSDEIEGHQKQAQLRKEPKAAQPPAFNTVFFTVKRGKGPADVLELQNSIGGEAESLRKSASLEISLAMAEIGGNEAFRAVNHLKNAAGHFHSAQAIYLEQGKLSSADLMGQFARSCTEKAERLQDTWDMEQFAKNAKPS